MLVWHPKATVKKVTRGLLGNSQRFRYKTCKHSDGFKTNWRSMILFVVFFYAVSQFIIASYGQSLVSLKVEYVMMNHKCSNIKRKSVNVWSNLRSITPNWTFWHPVMRLLKVNTSFSFWCCSFHPLWIAAKQLRRLSPDPVTSGWSRKSAWNPWLASVARQIQVWKPGIPVDTWSAHRWRSSWLPWKIFKQNVINLTDLPYFD